MERPGSVYWREHGLINKPALDPHESIRVPGKGGRESVSRC